MVKKYAEFILRPGMFIFTSSILSLARTSKVQVQAAEDLPQFVPVLLMFVPMKRMLEVKINTQGPKKFGVFFTIRLFPTHQTTSY